MPKNIDKAQSLQKLLNSIGLTANEMICCGDGFNDLSMIEYAGLGVAMENAQPIIKKPPTSSLVPMTKTAYPCDRYVYAIKKSFISAHTYNL